MANTNKLAGLAITAGTLGLGYVGLGQLENAGVISGVTDQIKDSLSGVLEYMEPALTYIGENAPFSELGLENLMNMNWVQAAIIGGTAIAGYAGAKYAENVVGDVVNAKSTSDNKIVGTSGALAAGELMTNVLLGTSSTICLKAGATGVSYVVGRKLGEKILGAQQAKWIGAAAALGTLGTLTAGTTTMVSPLLLGAGAFAGAGGLFLKGKELVTGGRSSTSTA